MTSYRVRYIDYPRHFRNNEKEYMEIIHDVLSRGDLMLRGQLRSFEEHLARFCGTRYAVGVGNCTEALLLALKAAGVGPGDEVVTVSHTFVATVSVIKHLGATPVLVDIGDDHLMDAAAMEQALTDKTKAIVPVQLNGRINGEMDRIMRIAGERGIAVVEDSAQALGAVLGGRKGGSFGLAGCFSFYPAKLLGAFGDGGAVVTDDEEVAERVRLLRNHGRAADGEIVEWGYNFRMDNLHAAILDFKLGLLPGWLERRRAIAALYDELLRDVAELRLPPSPESGTARYDVFQNYEVEAEDRDALVRHLRERGVETMLPWGGKGVHQFEALGLDFDLPRTDEVFSKVLLLPMYVELEDDGVEYVARSVREFYGR
ncbi:MAG TPA: DegT/DnrJ/EryC1/StrS family aminotransferase [Deltaproteobacteria bacterium]|nr:DegT/DnrJ/EryC1/StrS family aminotransferase [Deltaproteobacteria bacterium]